MHAVLCAATMKNISNSLGEENWRRKVISWTEVGGTVVRQGSVQQYRLGHHCVAERERHGEKGLEKGKEKLDVFCLHNTGEKLYGRLLAEWTEV